MHSGVVPQIHLVSAPHDQDYTFVYRVASVTVEQFLSRGGVGIERVGALRQS